MTVSIPRLPAAVLACLALSAPLAHANCPLVAGNLARTPDVAFVDHGDGTLTHVPTGLMWKQCVEGLTGAGCATGGLTTNDWAAALTLAGNDLTGAHADWRLPNKAELMSIVESGCSNPAINTTLFPNTPAGWFWTSSPLDAALSGDAWIVGFFYGSVVNAGKGLAGLVRLVRGGQSGDSFDRQADFTPDALGDYTPVTNATAGALVAAPGSKTVAGLTTVTGIKIDGEGSPEYRANGGAWTSVPDAVGNGAVIEVRLAAGAAASTRVATLTVGGVTAQFSVTAATVGGGGGGGGGEPESTLPFPSAPMAYACTGPDSGSLASTDAASARPLSSAMIMNRDLWLSASLARFAQPVDIYIVAELPDGELLVLDRAGRWLPYPAQATPWRANSSAALSATVWQSAIAAIPPGMYAAYLAAVPPGTSPATFSLRSSAYHLWCTTRRMP